MVHVSQTIMLYTLNLYSAVRQLYLNKTRRKNANFFDHQNVQTPSYSHDAVAGIRVRFNFLPQKTIRTRK